MQVEAVHRSSVEPILDVVGKLFGRADEACMSQARIPGLLQIFADDRVGLANIGDDRFTKADAPLKCLGVLDGGQNLIRERLVEYET